jgi:hypothetical protein
MDRTDDGAVFHTYSAHARGTDGLWGMDVPVARPCPLGRNEDGSQWFKRHDEYQRRAFGTDRSSRDQRFAVHRGPLVACAQMWGSPSLAGPGGFATLSKCPGFSSS